LQSRQRPQNPDGTAQEREPTGKRDTQKVEALVRGLAILRAFRRGDGPLGNAELAERTGLPKPTVSRLAYTLLEAGFLTYDARQRDYLLGPSLISSGCVALANLDVREIARPQLKNLARNASYNVGLGMRGRHEMIYVDAFEGDALISLRLFPGSRLPIATSAMGRAYLAALDSARREDLLQSLRPAHGEDWSRVLEGVAEAVESVERRGFCLAQGSWRTEINGAGAPLRSGDGSLYAINLGGPAYMLPLGELEERLGPLLAETARKIETQLAFDEAAVTIVE
jgi:DNA-binding IclR family transcriptional regulator